MRTLHLVLAAWFIAAFCVAPAQAGSDDEECEPVYVVQRVLNQRGPRLGRHGIKQMLEKLYPCLTRVPPRPKRVAYADGQGEEDDYEEPEEVIERVTAVRGRFPVVSEQAVRPSGDALALLIVRVTPDEEATSWSLELAVFGLHQGRLSLLGHEQLSDFDLVIDAGQDGGSGCELVTARVHAKAVALDLTVRTRLLSGEGSEENAERIWYGLDAQGGELVELLRLTVRESTSSLNEGDEGQGPIPFSETMFMRTVFGQKRNHGLLDVEVEQHRSEAHHGRVFRTEMDLILMCFDGQSYEDCTP
jgi:hypothetical protein